MTAAADCIFTNAAVHTLGDPDEVAEAVAVRDGEIVQVDDEYEVEFLEGVETEVVDLGGRVLLPGFIDAHTHLQHLGRSLVYADLSAAESPADCVDLLADSRATGGSFATTSTVAVASSVAPSSSSTASDTG